MKDDRRLLLLISLPYELHSTLLLPFHIANASSQNTFFWCHNDILPNTVDIFHVIVDVLHIRSQLLRDPLGRFLDTSMLTPILPLISPNAFLLSMPRKT